MVKQLKQAFFATFRPQSGAAPFFTSVIVWGIGIGCFAASLNNYLVDVHGLNQFQRGILEFFREMPGLLLVFLLALLHRTSDWRILRIGTIISMVGAISLCIPANMVVVTLMIMVWSTGEHLAMPVRSAIAMQIAQENRSGASLGYVSAAMHAGLVFGNLLVAAIFMVGLHLFGLTDRDELTSTLSTGISINHFISIMAAPLGGWIWLRWGVGTLFSMSALMAIANSLCAMQIPLRRKISPTSP